MRQITKNATSAFKANRKFCGANTNVCIYSKGNAELLLHMNRIAKRYEGKVSISLSGWNTVTTRERLNGLLKVYGKSYNVAQRQGKACLVWYDGNKQHKKVIDEYSFYSLDELDKMVGV